MTTHATQLSREVAQARAATLIDTLPWLTRYRGAVVVIKFGGNAMVSDELKTAFAEDIVYLHHVGLHPVVVHGGGPQISRALTDAGIHSEFRGGYRVTTPEAMDVVRHVLRDEVNREIVQLLNAHGDLAIGLSGEDAGLFTGAKRGAVVDGAEIDLGRVGDIIDVDPAVVRSAIEAGRIPVVSSIAPEHGDVSRPLNVNADAAAGALAAGMTASKLIVLTDVAGLYSDWPDTSSLVTSITADELRALMPKLEAGMIPKMSACLTAIDGGVEAASIIDGRVHHSILLELFTGPGVGTEVVKESR
ncbi:acetylglutamate kinase [Paramicrobacterium agarici]|uniref:Acetylglutamate kinase n=1 Tax=Paramicrobacterium agarici TaxID=630514 RepID=A0A2A9DXK3_9MICO|nr:acetylglutamate kinase [Microbacterium agarici]PFG31071.1 N-acetylglutamate kinase [Microbacterium agarici]